jgi:23S rRNA pseudouridine1911/1915/1917 synthase
MKTFDIVYKDPDLLIIDKPQGLPTTPGKLKENLFDLVSSVFPETNNIRGHKKTEGGLLNRLDNETGGLVFFARTQQGFDHYFTMMKNGEMTKIYHAVVEGIPPDEEGIIDIMIAHSRKNKRKMVCLDDETKLHRGHGQTARTEWKKLASKNKRTLLEVRITKGVRHQIRVHLAHIGNPIVGDRLYDKAKYPEMKNHLLYCIGTEFISLNGIFENVRIHSSLLTDFEM